ncbi:hypothetical protein, partial [Dermacoccus nishinomiyaensis]|uniref:hypothetical protein n=1 Tax=Dermacoccus nishinomiyaensis TaxID=1274 RepID=UPI0016429A85
GARFYVGEDVREERVLRTVGGGREMGVKVGEGVRGREGVEGAVTGVGMVWERMEGEGGVEVGELVDRLEVWRGVGMGRVRASMGRL